MKEIMFRGKDKVTNEWVYGYYYQETNNACFGNELVIKHCIRRQENIDWGITNQIYVEIQPKTLSQYLGITDKNNTKLFHGDIIDIHQTIYGYNKFLVLMGDLGIEVYYYSEPTQEIIRKYEYEYDLADLLEISKTDKEIEIVGNILDIVESINAN